MSKCHIKNRLKYFLFLTGLIVVLAGVFVPTYVFANTDGECSPAQKAAGGITRPAGGITGSGLGTRVTISTYCQEAGQPPDKGPVGDAVNGFLGELAGPLFKGIGQILMTLSSLILILSGWIFDEMIKFSIINMAENIGDPAGVGGSISAAWATLRDVANICFIFVLLYAAFKAMFELSFGNFQTTIKNIIIVALLINFSLFFSKVVIDASNIVAVGFYKSIATSNNNQGLQGGAFGSTSNFKGISGGYMRMLGLQTFYSADILNIKPGGQPLDATKIFIISFMSSAFMLIAATILLIAGIMFAARFIILIFLMILSPLALIAYIIPGQEGQFKKWREALVDQSFFAPLFFALTWVVFKVGSSLITVLSAQPGQKVGWTNIVTDPKSTMALLVNYVLIIGFSIAALVISKTMASKTAGFKAISGGIGAGVIGGAALAGRKSFGKVGQYVSNNQWLRERAPDSRLARTALKIGEKTGSASFDLRANKTLGKVPGLGDEMRGFGKAGGKGGYQAERESKIKRRMEFMEKNLQDNVTGADVEAEMERRGYGKEDNRRLGRTAAEVEEQRRKFQALLIAGAERNTELRKERYLHNLSQTRSRLQNAYSNVSEDAEAARRMREGKKSKSKKDKIADLIEEITGGTDDSTTPPPPSATPTP